MYIHEFAKSIPVIIKETGQEGYAIYVKDSGNFENDEWCIVLCEGGEVRHCLSNQIIIYQNTTFGIKKL